MNVMTGEGGDPAIIAQEVARLLEGLDPGVKHVSVAASVLKETINVCEELQQVWR
jgi:hypothetical protein